MFDLPAFQLQSADLVLTLGVTAVVLGLFIWNRLDPAVVGLIAMALLMVSGVVSTQQALSGFANEATITVALLLALSIGLLRTGAVDLIGRLLRRLGGTGEARMLAAIILLALPVSAFLNNTAVVAILVPTILAISHQSGLTASKLLMPLSFATQMGGTLTLIGTSTNLLVAGLILDLGVERIGLFDITPAALIVSLVGAAYLLTIGYWLTPRRRGSEDLLKQYELREYLTRIAIEAGSRLAGRSLSETRFREAYGLNVVLLEREGDRPRPPTGSTVLRTGDTLLVQGRIPDIAHIEQAERVRITAARATLSRAGTTSEQSTAATVQMAEVLIPPGSHVAGQSMTELDFRSRFGVNALAIQRHGRVIHEKLGRIPLVAGDILLVQGTPAALRALHEGRELALIGPVRIPAKRWRKRRIAIAIIAGVFLLPALDLAPILVSALVGVVLMLLTGCMSPGEVYEEMDWSVVILLGSIIPLGIAVESSGAAELMVQSLLQVTRDLGPYGVLAALYVATVALTSIITNAAAAVVLTPIAVSAGAALGLSPLPFIVAVMFAASSSFLTPIGYQTNLFVYGPGGYRFSDFIRVGAGLTVLSVATATFVIPLFFPF